MPTLEDAVILAATAHAGQLDHGGQPYLLHPIRVMLAGTTPAERLAGILHDVVEDSDLTLDDLRSAGYDEEIVVAVDHLTRREAETYEQFVQRTAANALARRVKLADLADNSDLSRLPEITDRDRERLARYQAAVAVIRAAEAAAPPAPA